MDMIREFTNLLAAKLAKLETETDLAGLASDAADPPADSADPPANSVDPPADRLNF